MTVFIFCANKKTLNFCKTCETLSLKPSIYFFIQIKIDIANRPSRFRQLDMFQIHDFFIILTQIIKSVFCRDNQIIKVDLDLNLSGSKSSEPVIGLKLIRNCCYFNFKILQKVFSFENFVNSEEPEITSLQTITDIDYWREITEV